MRREVFISYSTKDRPTAEQMCASLEAQGIPCWMAPRDIIPGNNWAKAIIKALNECRAMVLILSANANKSSQVCREVQLAADDENITIVPFRIEDVLPSDALKYFLGLPHWLDALTPPFEYHLQSLAEALRQLIPPTEVLPLPSPAPQGVGVFDKNGQLDSQQFAFNMGEVLLRAAFRRNRQRRQLVSLTDFLFGLIWKGDLTRFLLRQWKLDPDALADDFLKLIEAEGGAGGNGHGAAASDEAEWLANFDPQTADDEQWRVFFAKLIVRARDEFTEQLAQRIEDAGQRTHARVGEQRISEQDVLESFVADPAWLQQSALGLPNADEMCHLLRERAEAGEVDENGVVIFHSLDASAQKIIDVAHMLAQQHGLFPIPHRTMFAAFLKSESGYAADIFQRRGNDPEELLRVMLATAEDTSLFALSVEACERIVLPMVKEAEEIAAHQGAVTEQDLFQAFCRRAAPDFKEWLRTSPERIDLDYLDNEAIVRQRVQEFVAQAAAPYGAVVDVSPEVAPWLFKKARSEGCDVSYIQLMIEQHVKTSLMVALMSLKGAQQARLLLAVRPDKLRIECHRHVGAARR